MVLLHYRVTPGLAGSTTATNQPLTRTATAPAETGCDCQPVTAAPLADCGPDPLAAVLTVAA